MKQKLYVTFGLLAMVVATVIMLNIDRVDTQADELTPEMKSGMPCEMVEDYYPLYSVNGEVLDEELQKFIWKKLFKYGIQNDYNYRVFLCEVYQESHFDPYAYNASGNSYGFCQLKEIYFSEFLKMANLPLDTDLKKDYFANLQCGIAFFSHNLTLTDGNVDFALRKYYNSGDIYADSVYVGQVKQWLDTVEEVKK